MADQLCGPSNALQNFQKHSSTDRTLQQDRLHNRASPSQGFRSSPGPNAGLVNHDFEAFQAGLPLQEPASQAFAYNGSLQQVGQPGPSWANDFQRLNLSSPPPQLQSHAQHHAAQSSWHQDFLQQSHQNQAQNQMYNAPVERLSSIVPMQGQYQPMFGGPSMMNHHLQNQMQPSQAPLQQSAEIFDEAAFARAFDEAAQAELSAQEAAQQATEQVEDTMTSESSTQPLASEPAQQQNLERIGADLIHDPDGRPDQHQELQGDPDALSRTAGELLNRVKDNTSAKFQNSQFLELMRQLRDKEVLVEGNEIVDAVAGARDSVQEETQAAAP